MQNCLARWWPFDRNASSSLCCACMRVRLFSSRNDSVWEQEGRAAGRRGSEREREREGLQTSHSSSSASRGLWMRPVQTTRSEDYSCCLVAYAQKASGAEKGAAAHIELAAVTLMSKVIRRGFFLFLAFLLSLSLSRWFPLFSTILLISLPFLRRARMIPSFFFFFSRCFLGSAVVAAHKYLRTAGSFNAEPMKYPRPRTHSTPLRIRVSVWESEPPWAAAIVTRVEMPSPDSIRKRLMCSRWTPRWCIKLKESQTPSVSHRHMGGEQGRLKTKKRR